MIPQECEALNRIQAMRRQEDQFYTVSTNDDEYLDDTTFANILDWRRKMAIYCYRITDFCSYERETASIAISFLDRFLWADFPERNTNLRPMEALAIETREAAYDDREIFQLLAIGCLYTAAKINEIEPLDPLTLSNFVHGIYSPSQIEEMEATVLEALQWHVHPPTAMAFVRELSDVCIATLLRHADGKAIMMDSSLRQMFSDLTTRQTEIAMSEYNLVGAKASYIAHSSILNALQILSRSNHLIRDIELLLQEALEITGAEQSLSVQNTSTEIRESLVVNKQGDEIDVVLQGYHGSSTGSLMSLEPNRGPKPLRLVDLQDYLFNQILMEGQFHELSDAATHKDTRSDQNRSEDEKRKYEELRNSAASPKCVMR